MVGREHVFISYARSDGRKQADRLHHELGLYGIFAWRDERNLDPYQDFSAEIEKAIEDSSHVVICLTPSIAERKDSFVRREIIYALGCHKPITPLLYRNYPKGRIPTLINHLTWIDFHNFQSGLIRLLARLRQPPEFEAPPKKIDPFEDYLYVLYHQIVEFLDKTVFSLIDLCTETVAGLIEPPYGKRPNILPQSIFATSLSVKEPESIPSEEAHRLHFDNFSDAFKHFNGRMLLLGEPGAGKTTTLMAYARDVVAHRLDDASQPLPLIARVADWPKETPLIDWLSSYIDSENRDTSRLIRTEIRNGRTVILLDGLDELGAEYEDSEAKKFFDPRPRFLLALQNCPGSNRVLVTCRTSDFKDAEGKIALNGAVVLKPLDDTQLADYLADYPDLWLAIQADNALKEMVRTPLLLSLLTYAFLGVGEKARDLHDLSHSSGELRDAIFRIYIERRYEHEKLRRNADLSFTLESMYEALGFAAMRDVVLRDILERAWVGDTIKSSLRTLLGRQTEDFINQICRLHILVYDSKKILQFIHTLLRNYLALPYCLSHLDSPDTALRAWSAETLGEIKDKRAVVSLVAALSDGDVAVRWQVSEALTKIGDPVLACLINTLPTLSSRGKWWAIQVLWEIGDDRAVDPLLSALNDVDVDLRRQAVRALVKIRSVRASKALILALDDPDSDVQRWAAKALKGIGTSESKAAAESWERNHGEPDHGWVAE